MQVIELATIALCIYVIPVSILIYFYYHGQQALQVEEYRQSCITNRQYSKPQEWWQQMLIELAKNPEAIDKLKAILPEGLAESTISQFMRK